MNKRQARRIALATNASYLLFGASTDGVTDRLTDADSQKYHDAQNELAWDMLRRAGFSQPMHAHEIVAAVLYPPGTKAGKLRAEANDAHVIAAELARVRPDSERLPALQDKARQLSKLAGQAEGNAPDTEAE